MKSEQEILWEYFNNPGTIGGECNRFWIAPQRRDTGTPTQ